MTKGMAQKSREENLGPQTSPFSRKYQMTLNVKCLYLEKKKRSKSYQNSMDKDHHTFGCPCHHNSSIMNTWMLIKVNVCLYRNSIIWQQVLSYCTVARICCSIAILSKNYRKFNLSKIQKCTSRIHIVVFFPQTATLFVLSAATFRWLTCPDHLNKITRLVCISCAKYGCGLQVSGCQP